MKQLKTTSSLRMILPCMTLVLMGCEQSHKKTVAPLQQAPQEVPLVIESEEKEPANASEEASDQYYQAYLLMREAEREVDHDLALQKQQTALDSFQAIQIKFPEWKSKMVEERIEVMIQIIAKTKARIQSEGARRD